MKKYRHKIHLSNDFPSVFLSFFFIFTKIQDRYGISLWSLTKRIDFYSLKHINLTHNLQCRSYFETRTIVIACRGVRDH